MSGSPLSVSLPNAPASPLDKKGRISPHELSEFERLPHLVFEAIFKHIDLQSRAALRRCSTHLARIGETHKKVPHVGEKLRIQFHSQYTGDSGRRGRVVRFSTRIHLGPSPRDDPYALGGVEWKHQMLSGDWSDGLDEDGGAGQIAYRMRVASFFDDLVVSHGKWVTDVEFEDIQMAPRRIEFDRLIPSYMVHMDRLPNLRRLHLTNTRFGSNDYYSGWSVSTPLDVIVRCGKEPDHRFDFIATIKFALALGRVGRLSIDHTTDYFKSMILDYKRFLVADAQRYPEQGEKWLCDELSLPVPAYDCMDDTISWISTKCHRLDLGFHLGMILSQMPVKYPLSGLAFRKRIQKLDSSKFGTLSFYAVPMSTEKELDDWAECLISLQCERVVIGANWPGYHRTSEEEEWAERLRQRIGNKASE